jgi:hypothetical protein
MPNPKALFDPTLDYRAHPERYRVGIGEQGVLTVQPYKSEILPHWRFSTPDIARESSDKIYALFLDYKAKNDFIGMDMARKFLQMGMTRARRYSNHTGGKKYSGPVPKEHRGESGAWGRETLPYSPDPEKAESAAIFREKWLLAKEDTDYQRLKKQHQETEKTRP